MLNRMMKLERKVIKNKITQVSMNQILNLLFQTNQIKRILQQIKEKKKLSKVKRINNNNNKDQIFVQKMRIN